MRQPNAEMDSDDTGFVKTYRDSIDMGVAIASRMKLSGDEKPSMTTHPQPPTPTAVSARLRTPLKGRAFGLSKRMLRRMVGPIYRSAKPIVRPFTSRIRRSLLESFRLESRAAQDELRQQVAASQALLREIMARDEAISLRIAASQQSSQRGLTDVRASMNVISARLDGIEAYSEAGARRVAVNCGSDEVLVRAQAGFVLCSSSDPALLAVLLESGDLERGTRLLIETLLEPGNVFIDVGANIGLHTLAAARAMRGTGRIVAFEPFEPTMRLLQKSVFINGFANLVESHQIAVSDHVGTTTLYLGMTSGHHSLYPLSYPLSLGLQTMTTAVDTPVNTLDGVLAPDVFPDLIKIDVEGAELEVIRGARAAIERNANVALIVEFGSSHLARTGQSTSDWLATFENLGLVYQVIEAMTGALEPWSVQQLEQAESVNLLFARPGAAVWEKVRKA